MLDDIAAVTILDHFRQPTDPCRHHRDSPRHRLNAGETKGLKRLRGHDKHIGTGEQVQRIRPETLESHLPRQTEALAASRDPGSLRLCPESAYKQACGWHLS